MAFRAMEAAESGFEDMVARFVPRDLATDEKVETINRLRGIARELGPIVDAYPSWHPIVRNHDRHYPETLPSERCGYKGLDHTFYFTHGFITCPYGDGQAVINSAENQPVDQVASISAEALDLKLWSKGTTPILVRCDWHVALGPQHQVPKWLAVPLMLEQELPCWRWAQRPESWETMRPYFLGSPHGARSSLFVDQDTALALKKTHNALVDSGMFGALSS